LEKIRGAKTNIEYDCAYEKAVGDGGKYVLLTLLADI